MALLKRLGYYSIGLVLGSIMVWVFFGDRDIQCSYFPNDRVLSDLRKKEISFSENSQCLWDCYQLDSTAYHHILNNATIDFGKSQTRDTAAKVYYLETGNFSPAFAIEIENRDSTAEVVSFHYKGDSQVDCDCP
ncbi:MAG: hypothetical protein SchgKO_08180 [Schleiferiaceae bacterium]